MKAFSLWKQLKRKLRRNGRPVWTLASMLALVVYGSIALVEPAAAASVAQFDVEPSAAQWTFNGNIETEGQWQKLEKAIATVKQPMIVRIHRTYICGEEYRSLGLLPIDRALKIAKRPTVSFARLNTSSSAMPSLILEERVSDLSEACKQHAVIGLDHAGRLTLYDGPPKKEKVVRTFYQLDVNFMESSLPEEEIKRLTNGIRIEDKETYYSVLSSFSDFALDASRQTMTP
ncbi:forespore regulator of the sigma-K checkpoint [Paenibacillus cellulosilyticus]|uniref:Forespore regulator of the sigma-K checkpoint n=1 Tax=Paenibacillus cellulosilyticus TaxID=375489 RepID=A0A2V2YGM2_9BACL|nr:BofC C-terminal domain-containing protein [Paenibacillus cellulosilyticus]PWV91976.1 forespore regulator of the sigma-K checkpoint [Paenibacillus cellulosilyticus]QKS46666.1 BofC C-terminal domain-containing protein [Paenibacillus cellulosilyticus]